MKIQFTIALLAAMLTSCHSTSQTSGTVQATPKYTFKKVDVLTVSPCVQCIMTKAKKKYRRQRAIPFERCVSGSQDKRFLKLSAVKGNENIKLVISPDCSGGLTSNGVGTCSSSENCGLIIWENNLSTELLHIYCQSQKVLSIEMNATSVRVVTLESGWDLYYETVVCPQ